MSTTAMNATRRYFEKRADAFDRLYRRSTPGTWWLRRGPRRSRDYAAAVVARHSSPSVLDVGCGPGRVGEAVIEAGASSYTGIDFSPHMLELARARLQRFDSVELIDGDFFDLDLPRTFDVVLALGLFDYLDEPVRAAKWMRPRVGGMLVATFSRRDRIKTPIRRFHYELLHRCPLFFYSEADGEEILRAAGFSVVELASRGRRGFFLEARP